MSFQPFIVGSGLPAWSLLKSTLSTQRIAFDGNFATQSDTQYFQNHFAEIENAEDIVSNRRILRVVLGAYGLSGDIDNRHFVKTILTQGVTDPSALANKLSDRRYQALAADFDFSVSPPTHKNIPNLAQATVSKYRTQMFETAIGDADPDMRLALSFQHSLKDIASQASSNSAAWYQIIGTPPLREVVDSALGLPADFANLDIDDQHTRLMEKADRIFGTNLVTEMAEDNVAEEITQRFLLLKQISSTQATSSLHTALALLSAISYE